MTSFSPDQEILARGLSDWVDLSEILGLTRRWAQRDDLDTRSEVLRILKGLIESRLMAPGDVTRDEGFIEWSLSPDGSMAEIVQRWDALGREPTVGDVCWLRNTAEGDRRGEEILAQHGPDRTWIFEE